MNSKDERTERKWSENDLKTLRRLVRKYGLESLSETASNVIPRPPGRPPRGILPELESMHLTDWLEEQIAEHKRLGNSAPQKRAINDAYELEHSDDPDRPDPEKYAKTTKRKLYLARRKLRHQQETAERINSKIRIPKGRKK